MSLVAIRRAMPSLRSGEVDLALAGGVTMGPSILWGFPAAGGWLPMGDGRAGGRGSRSAPGRVGEGWGCAERLSDARRLGWPALAVVRGSAVNQDGVQSTG